MIKINVQVTSIIQKVRGNDNFQSEINVTPFVDVMLVLLVIFMVTAPIIKASLKVKLPSAKGEQSVETKDTIVIQVDSKGRISIDGVKTTLTSLPSVLREHARMGVKKAHIEADKRVRYGKVISVISEVKKVGIKAIGLVVIPEK